MNGFGAIKWLARVGFLVKGVLYMVISALALQVAAKVRTRNGDARRADDRPRTTIRPYAAARVVAGLLGCAAWRILQGLFDPDRLGNNWRGLAIRASFVARGALHAVLGWQAFRLYRGLSAASGISSEREVATEAFRWPLGDWLVVLAGLGLTGSAVQQVYAAISCRLERNLDVEEMRREAGEWAVGLSRFGVAARAVVFALLGWAIVVAGWFRDPSEIGTTASSFRTLAAQPGGLGRWLLGVTAAGFVAYGFYEIIHARYLHIRRVRQVRTCEAWEPGFKPATFRSRTECSAGLGERSLSASEMSPRLSLRGAKTENRGWTRGEFPFSKPPPSASRPPHRSP